MLNLTTVKKYRIMAEDPDGDLPAELLATRFGREVARREADRLRTIMHQTRTLHGRRVFVADQTGREI